MTRMPKIVDWWTPFSAARHLMAQEGIEHLPVLEDGMIAGLLNADDTAPTGVTAGALVDDVDHAEPRRRRARRLGHGPRRRDEATRPSLRARCRRR